MNAHPVDALLEGLCSGDDAAAEQVFLSYKPYLCAIVQRQMPARLRAKFDPMDVVQSIWADVLEGFRRSAWHFADADHLRRFLARVTRNRVIDLTRQQRGALEREQDLGDAGADQLPSSPQPRPSQLAQAEDLWQHILALCPPAHHELLRLKRDGCSLDEIAARTGLHKSSVRRIIYDLGRRLAARGMDLPGSLGTAL
jgi:RNA polymerase sigma factor (sigma-70 family)